MNEILIPVEVKYYIENIEFSGVKEHNVGDIYYFNPDRYIDIELQDSGFFIPIDNSKCSFYCDTTELDFNNKLYNYGEKLDIEGIADSTIDDLCYIGYIKKVVKSLETSEEKTKDKPKNKSKKKKNFKYGDVAKKLDVAFKDFKSKALSLGIEIGKANDKIAKSKMTEILKALQ